MGAVRIYKAPYTSSYGSRFVWVVRSHDCPSNSSEECIYGASHKGYCNGYTSFEDLLKKLNAPHSDLGAYIKK